MNTNTVDLYQSVLNEKKVLLEMKTAFAKNGLNKINGLTYAVCGDNVVITMGIHIWNSQVFYGESVIAAGEITKKRVKQAALEAIFNAKKDIIFCCNREFNRLAEIESTLSNK